MKRFNRALKVYSSLTDDISKRDIALLKAICSIFEYSETGCARQLCAYLDKFSCFSLSGLTQYQVSEINFILQYSNFTEDEITKFKPPVIDGAFEEYKLITPSKFINRLAYFINFARQYKQERGDVIR